MILLKLLFLPIKLILLPFKLLFGSGSNDTDYDKIDSFLDDCDYFDSHR